MAIFLYEIPAISTIRKAAVPIIGGMMPPPVAATAVTAPENVPSYPAFFIIGIVNEPVVTTFAVGLPLIMPKRPLVMIATLPAPPA